MDAMVACPMPWVTLALPSSLLWAGAAAGKKEGGESSPFLQLVEALLALPPRDSRLRCPVWIWCSLEGKAYWKRLHWGLDMRPGAAERCVGPEPCTRPLFQSSQISWAATRESKLPNFPLHGHSHPTDCWKIQHPLGTWGDVWFLALPA